jgi:hypothetical protein
METDDIPFLVQRVLHVSDGTTMDVGVVYAIDDEAARQQAVEHGLVGLLHTFRVLSLRAWGLGVPAHFAEERLRSLVDEHARVKTYLSMHARAETPDQLGHARISPGLHDYLSERARTILANLGPSQGRPNAVVMAVAKALIATHAHHDHSIGAPRADGLVLLSLDGKGEYHDHRWLLAPDGTVTDDA